MNQFFKYFLAAVAGTIVAFILIGIFLALFGAVAAAFSGDKTEIKDGSVLKLNFELPLAEHTNNAETSPFLFSDEDVLGVFDFVEVIEKAKTDDAIKGIYIETMDLPLSLTGTNILRDALIDFKESGKFIVAYSNFYTQNAYYLASVADEVYLNPLGGVDFRGYAVSASFYKNMLDKLGIDMEVFYVGRYKGATEPYRFTEFSEDNKTQYREYLNHLYDAYLTGLSKARNIPTDTLRALADRYAGGEATDALATGLVDIVGYQDQAYDDIRNRLGLDANKKFPLVSINKYTNGKAPRAKKSKAKESIAVVYAEGVINMGDMDAGSIGEENYMELIRKLKNNDKIKAVVLRVNSPGGSAMASENIWRELQLLKEAGKPVIVSMGAVAASGGYYIAAAGDTILAEPTTLTGSIGIYAMLPNMKGFMNDKLGVTFDTVRTGPFATGLHLGMDLSEGEKRWWQADTERSYEIFLQRVAESRDMTRDEVHSIAQGRVWTADRALKNGLVDAIGGLDDAIAIAAERVNLEEYRVREYPALKNVMEQLIDDFLNPEKARAKAIKAELGTFYPYYETLKNVEQLKGQQARLPYMITVQ